MIRAKMPTPSPHTPPPSVNSRHVGIYHVSSPGYSRKRCLKTMIDLDPELVIIYIKLNRANYEVAKRSSILRRHGQVGFHFNAHWKIETVTL